MSEVCLCRQTSRRDLVRRLECEECHLLSVARSELDLRKYGADFINLMPTSLYGPDDYHVDDLADACVHVMKTYSDSDPILVREDLGIHDYAQRVAD